MPRSFRLLLLAPLLALPPVLSGQVAQSPAVMLANMRQEVDLLTQRIGELSLRVEQLERQNAELAKAAAGAQRNLATISQLNTAIADLTRDIKAASAQTKSEVLAVVATQMENLAKQTNAALDAVAKNRAAAQVVFSDNFPKEGVTYTVQAGDTLSRIAQKTGARLNDIINANKIVDPTKVQVGQVLFIPGGK
jgi:Membrane proteins related to metalloendopeptidases